MIERSRKRYGYNSGSVRCELGTVPLLLTIPHGGRSNSIDGKELPVVNPDRPNEYAAGELADRMQEVFLKTDISAFIVEEMVERSRMTRDRLSSFYQEVSRIVSLCLAKFGECYLLDLHVFASYPPVGEYNVVLGTDHRRTVKRSFDIKFADILERMSFNEVVFSVFVPAEEPIMGEKFGATKKAALAKNITLQYPNVCAMQIEVHKDFFADGRNTMRIAEAFATAAYSLFRFSPPRLTLP